MRGGIWKGDVLIADLEELETMDASEIYSKRLKQKEQVLAECQAEIKKHEFQANYDTASTNSRREQY